MTVPDRAQAPWNALQQYGGFEAWRDEAERLGFSDFISPEDDFNRCLMKGQPWSNHRRAGIYFWLAADGEAYVGQSVQPRSRLRQHLKVHGDLVCAAFQPCAAEALDATEAKLIEDAGKKFLLRNIKLAISTASQVPFDEVVPLEDQSIFLTGGHLQDTAWSTLEQLERVQRGKFERFVRHTEAAQAVEILSLFLKRAIPRPAATEAKFWSVTIKPTGRLLRVNVGQQEVFTFEAHRDGNVVRIMTDSPVSLFNSWPTGYQTRSFETQLAPHRVETWLTDKRLLACRRLVIQLMRHTQALNSSSHCPQVVKSIRPRTARPER